MLWRQKEMQRVFSPIYSCVTVIRHLLARRFLQGFHELLFVLERGDAEFLLGGDQGLCNAQI